MHTVAAAKRRVCVEVHVLGRGREQDVVAVLPTQLTLRGAHLPLQVAAAVVLDDGVEELQDVVPCLVAVVVTHAVYVIVEAQERRCWPPLKIPVDVLTSSVPVLSTVRPTLRLLPIRLAILLTVLPPAVASIVPACLPPRLVLIPCLAIPHLVEEVSLLAEQPVACVH